MRPVVQFNMTSEVDSDLAPRSPGRTAGFAAAGILLALVLIGQVFYVLDLRGTAQTAPVVPVHAGPAQRLSASIAAALGPSDRGVRRFRLALQRSPGARTWELTVTWAINSNLSQGTVGNGAENDVYNILQAVYTSGLPIRSTRLVGTYPLGSTSGHAHEAVVMRLLMSATRAALVNGISWDTLTPQDVWGLLDRRSVNPAVRPLVSE